MILYYAADLLWSTRIKATAEDLGLSARPVRNVQMLEARLADSAPPPTGLILDLETGEAGLQLLAHLRRVERERLASNPPPPTATPSNTPTPTRSPGLHVVAFGPHVARDLFTRAREAGADEVMTRGAFDHQLPEVLRRLGLREPK